MIKVNIQFSLKILLSVDNVVDYYKKLTTKYPIKSIEDPFAEDDWECLEKNY